MGGGDGSYSIEEERERERGRREIESFAGDLTNFLQGVVKVEVRPEDSLTEVLSHGREGYGLAMWDFSSYVASRLKDIFPKTNVQASDVIQQNLCCTTISSAADFLYRAGDTIQSGQPCRFLQGRVEEAA